MKLKLVALFTMLFSLALMAESMINITMSPIFPTESNVMNSLGKNAAWNTSAEWGVTFDDKILVGAQVDFMWFVDKDKSIVDDTTSGDTYEKVDGKTKMFMFPVSAFIGLSPIPQYRLHPVAKVQVGYNSLTLSKEIESQNIDESAYYNGLITKFGVDAVYDLGKQSSIFAGFQYQISELEKRGDGPSVVENMNGPSIRMGISVYY